MDIDTLNKNFAMVAGVILAVVFTYMLFGKRFAFYLLLTIFAGQVVLNWTLLDKMWKGVLA